MNLKGTATSNTLYEAKHLCHGKPTLVQCATDSVQPSPKLIVHAVSFIGRGLISYAVDQIRYTLRLAGRETRHIGTQESNYIEVRLDSDLIGHFKNKSHHLHDEQTLVYYQEPK